MVLSKVEIPMHHIIHIQGIGILENYAHFHWFVSFHISILSYHANEKIIYEIVKYNIDNALKYLVNDSFIWYLYI